MLITEHPAYRHRGGVLSWPMLLNEPRGLAFGRIAAVANFEPFIMAISISIGFTTIGARGIRAITLQMTLAAALAGLSVSDCRSHILCGKENSNRTIQVSGLPSHNTPEKVRNG